LVTQLQRVPQSEPFRWKLFLMVVLIMGAITTAAIVLTLISHPSGGGLHIPTLQPIVTILLGS
jgi:hypothetical protein